MAKSWKQLEKKTTAWYSEAGTEAVRMSRPFRGEAVEDIAWGKFSIEHKSSKTGHPSYLLLWMKQAATNCAGRIPIVHWHKDGAHIKDDLVVLRAEDFRRIAEVYNESTAGGLL